METALFYILSSVVLVFAVLSVTTRKILRSAVYLLFVLAATSGFYFMFNYFFLAGVQLLVYVGGVLVLIIFSVLLTSQLDQKLDKVERKKMFFSALLTIAGAALSIYVITSYSFPPTPGLEGDASVKAIGRKMLSYEKDGYVLPFEVISLLLLAAMVGAIVIAKKEKKEAND